MSLIHIPGIVKPRFPVLSKPEGGRPDHVHDVHSSAASGSRLVDSENSRINFHGLGTKPTTAKPISGTIRRTGPSCTRFLLL